MGISSASRLVRPILADAIIALAAYTVAWTIRFGDTLAHFAPFARRAMPIVIAAQIAGLWIVGAWRRPFDVGTLIRVPLGVAAGSVVGIVVAFGALGNEGLSRTALTFDLGLLVAGAVTWRAVIILWQMSRPAPIDAAAPPPGLEPRLKRVSLGAELLALYEYRTLLRSIVIRDLKLKYRGSVIGALWSLVNPLLMMTVYVVAFTYILRIRSAGFVLYLQLGLLAWTFFATSASMSTGSIVDSGGLVKSVYFPRSVLPVGTVLFNFAQFLLTTIVILPVLLWYYGVPLGPQMLLYPVFLFLQLVFTAGIALMLSAATTLYRDVRHLLEIALSALFWLTPIVYEAVTLPDRLRLPILLTPVSSYVVAYHQIFYYRTWPDATIWFVAVTYAATSLVAGATVFLANEHRFAEQI